MKIGYKLTSSFLIFTLSITVLFYLIGLQNQNDNLKEIAREHMRELKASFSNLEERDTRILLSAIEVIIQDRSLKAVYLEKNRDKLYNYAQPLFQNLKNKYGITHFYFILPDGRVFLRLHDKEIYGDLIKRISFQKARDTKNPAWEIELGKTAFALRAVMPYYNAGQLIGYVELGEEINHFLKILKGVTSSEFAIIADKEYLDRGDWESVRRVAQLRNNWDDLEKHLVLSTTTEGEIARECFVEDNLERIEKGENILQQLQRNNGSFMCGGFELNNAGGQHIGAVLSLTAMTEHIAVAQKANNAKLRIAIIFFLVTFITSIFISRSITKPILELAEAAKAVGSGDLDRRVGISSTDEIGQLGITFNDMIERRKRSDEELRKHREELSKLIDERTSELRIANESLIREITERKLAEAEAMRASQLAALGELSAGVAHEINNPINGIINYSQMLLNKFDPESREYDISKRIIKESDRIANIVRNLLSFARNKEEERFPVNVQGIIVDALALTETQLRKDGINLKVNISPDLPEIIAHPQQIQQVFLNIISNARDALNQKYPGAHENKILEILAKEVTIDNHTYIQITFYDRGTGIPAELLDKVMLPFFTTKRGDMGTGLGLSISHGIIKSHGGKLMINSVDGEFTKVIINLPRK